MNPKILVDEAEGAEILDISRTKFRRQRVTDPRFPKGRKFGGNTKYVLDELREYALTLPTVEPGTRGLRGEKRSEPEAA